MTSCAASQRRACETLPTARLRERELLRSSLTDADGVTGYGEAAPLSPTTASASSGCSEALERYRAGAGASASGSHGAAAARRLPRASTTCPQALAAIDLALWDRAGRRAGRPGRGAARPTRPRRTVAVNATLSRARPRGRRRAGGARGCAPGFECVKLKVGVGDDAGRVAAVRAAAGPEMALRLDANGAWDVEQAVRAIEALAPAGLELVEEPVHGLRGGARACASGSRCGSRSTRPRPSTARSAPASPTRSA